MNPKALALLQEKASREEREAFLLFQSCQSRLLELQSKKEMVEQQPRPTSVVWWESWLLAQTAELKRLEQALTTMKIELKQAEEQWKGARIICLKWLKIEEWDKQEQLIMSERRAQKDSDEWRKTVGKWDSESDVK